MLLDTCSPYTYKSNKANVLDYSKIYTKTPSFVYGFKRFLRGKAIDSTRSEGNISGNNYECKSHTCVKNI